MKARRRMCGASSLKHEFLKNWIKGLRICRNIKKDEASTILERKNAIKLSADVAIASARNPTTHWSRAVVSRNKSMVEQILGHKVETPKTKASTSSRLMAACSRRILRRNRINGGGKARAWSLVKKRTRVLRKLVPGGEEIDDGLSLIRETLDYIVSLRLQVDVMRHLATAAAISHPY